VPVFSLLYYSLVINVIYLLHLDHGFRWFTPAHASHTVLITYLLENLQFIAMVAEVGSN